MKRWGEGSAFCAEDGLERLVWADSAEDISDCIAQEKRMKRWRRAWKFARIKRDNPEWRDRYDRLA